MLDVFSQFSGFLKFDTVCIDNNVFRLHYKVTVMIMTIATVLNGARQYVGDPIDCMSDGVPGGILDTYCWIHSTFSIPDRWVGKQGEDHAYPGIAPINPNGQDPVYHKYYQWVCFVLFLQAGLFYVPRYLWKSAEGGRLNMLVQGMMEPRIVVNKSERAERIGIIVKYFRDNRGSHGLYFLRFIFCEVLNFVNVIGQMFLMDRFLGYEFSTYGMSVIGYTEMDPQDRADPMAIVFPKITKCSFYKYGPSGTIETHDALCVLPMNIINEKIYVFIWFWFIIVASITGLFLVYRLFVLLGSGIRTAMIQARTGRLSRDKIEDIVSAPGLTYLQQVGDFFLLYLIAKNVDEVTMKELIIDLHSTLKPAYSDAPTLKAGSDENKSSA